MEKLHIKKTGGYDEHFKDEPLDDYKCPVCLLVLCEPIQTQCGHRLCMSCSEEIKKRNRGVLICPLDTQISNSDRTFPDVAFERVILQLKVNCNNFKQSCTWTGDLGLINNHLQSCEYQEVSCLNDECWDSLLRKELSDHMETRCNYRSVTCQYCTERILHFNLQCHLGHCKFFPLDCVNRCGKIILRKEMTSHTTDDCSLTIIPCQFSNIGCNFKGMRKEKDDHAISSTHIHLSMAISKIDLLENKIILKEKDTAAKITSLENLINSNINKMAVIENQRRLGRNIFENCPSTVVADTNCYIDHLALMQTLLQSKMFCIIVPLIVINELDGLKKGSSNTNQRLQQCAGFAVDMLEDWFSRKDSCLRAITSNGTEMTTIAFRAEEFSSDRGNNDDVILSCCVRYCKENMTRSEGDSRIVLRSVVLLTDDRNLRVKAHTRSVPTTDVVTFIKMAKLV